METKEEQPKKKRQINPDRIVLDGASVALIKSMQDQIENAFGGLVKLTVKEVANFVLQQRATEPLMLSELAAIRAKYFDDVQAAQWALQRLKAAKEAGQSLSLNEVLEQLQTPVVKEKRHPKARKVKTPALTSGPSHVELASLAEAKSCELKTDLKECSGEQLSI